MEEKDSKEINLLDLIRIFFNWLKRLGLGFLNLITNTLRLLYRHKIMICVILACCVALGFYLGRPSQREYKAEAMAILNGSIAQTVKEVSRQLEHSSTLSNFTTLSSKLSLPDSVAKNITGIESFYVVDFLNDSTPDMVDFKGKHSWEDTLNVRMPNRLYFRIKVRCVSQLPEIETAFLDYFNTNDRLASEFNVKKNNLSREIQLLNAEINRLDSMAEISYFKGIDQQVQLRSNTLLVGEQRKQLLYEHFLFLQEKKMKREIEFANCTDPVVLPTGFIANTRHEAGRVKYTIHCCLVGLLISILLALFIENRKCIFNYLSKK